MYTYSELLIMVLFFKQRTAYEVRISDWSSDVCSSDLRPHAAKTVEIGYDPFGEADLAAHPIERLDMATLFIIDDVAQIFEISLQHVQRAQPVQRLNRVIGVANPARSEEHTSELQSLLRISYAVFCLKKKKKNKK